MGAPDSSQLLVIAGATACQNGQLRSGGGRVAQGPGATLVSDVGMDPLHQRLRNVVEEMAIASGVPVPEIYVLEHERVSTHLLPVMHPRMPLSLLPGARSNS